MRRGGEKRGLPRTGRATSHLDRSPLHAKQEQEIPDTGMGQRSGMNPETRLPHVDAGALAGVGTYKLTITATAAGKTASSTLTIKLE